MFGLKAAQITAKCVMEVKVNELKLLRFLLRVTKRNKLHNRYIYREKLVVKRETQDSFLVLNDLDSHA